MNLLSPQTPFSRLLPSCSVLSPVSAVLPLEHPHRQSFLSIPDAMPSTQTLAILHLDNYHPLLEVPLALLSPSLSSIPCQSDLSNMQITPRLKTFKWLPVAYRIKFKLLSMTCKTCCNLTLPPPASSSPSPLTTPTSSLQTFFPCFPPSCPSYLLQAS